MRRSTGVTFAMRDFDRLKCIQAVVDGELKPLRAAERLGLTTRQVRRLARRYAAAGPVALISKRFSRPSNNRLDDAMADQVIKLLRSTYADFGPTLATEKLRTKPLAFYSDKASIFRINKASATGGDRHTQFGRALFELNIDGICANTPAAKGRVERAHLTMQDRLVKELRLEGISTIEAANAFMPAYDARPHRPDRIEIRTEFCRQIFRRPLERVGARSSSSV